MPTIAMGEADKDWAISFACPADAEGLYMVYGRQSCDTRKLEGCSIDVGNAKFGGQEALVVLDHVFIPNEYIFLNGEYDFAGMMGERFAGYHRQSYGGCKVGVGDVVIGAAALAAEYNGAEKASHIKDKLIEMTHLNETLYSCGIARYSRECFHRGPPEGTALPRKHLPRRRGGRLPYRVPARRGLSTGPAHHDRPSGQHSGQEAACQEYRRHFKITTPLFIFLPQSAAKGPKRSFAADCILPLFTKRHQAEREKRRRSDARSSLQFFTM